MAQSNCRYDREFEAQELLKHSAVANTVKCLRKIKGKDNDECISVEKCCDGMKKLNECCSG